MQIKVVMNGDIMTIGEIPRLVVNLKTQKNFIEVDGITIPYAREVSLSKDLLEGKRRNVYETAIKHYYIKACQVAEGIRLAKSYRSMANTSDREIKIRA